MPSVPYLALDLGGGGVIQGINLTKNDGENVLYTVRIAGMETRNTSTTCPCIKTKKGGVVSKGGGGRRGRKFSQWLSGSRSGAGIVLGLDRHGGLAVEWVAVGSLYISAVFIKDKT